MTKFGHWIERHFPEKLTAEDVKRDFDKFSNQLVDMVSELNRSRERIVALELRVGQREKINANYYADTTKLISELNTLKTQMGVKSRIVGSDPNVSPFATRLQPVRPATESATSGGAPLAP